MSCGDEPAAHALRKGHSLPKIYVIYKDKEKIYGWLALEVSALEKGVVLLRSELDRIGTNFEKAGESIKCR